MGMRSRLHSRAAIACLGIIAAASLLAMAPASARRTGPAQAGASPHVITTIPVDRKPLNIAVDPVTDMIYVTELAQLQVIDGKTNTVVATVHMPNQTFDIAVDPATDLIYATDSNQRSVLAIDGKTNIVVAQIKIGGFGFWIATDPRTDRIYAEAATSPGVETVAVIDGRTNTLVTRIPANSGFFDGLAVNPRTNMIYARSGSFMLTISGQTNTVTAMTDMTPTYIATDPVTNTIYATEPFPNGPGLVYVVDGQTSTLTTTIPGGSPDGIATDPSTSFVYTADFYANNLKVINERTSKVTARVGVGRHPQGVAADPQTNMVYVANNSSSSVSVLARLTSIARRPRRRALLGQAVAGREFDTGRAHHAGDEAGLGVGVGVPVAAVLAGQLLLQGGVLGAELRVGAERVPEGDQRAGVRIAVLDHVQVVSAGRRARAQEPQPVVLARGLPARTPIRRLVAVPRHPGPGSAT